MGYPKEYEPQQGYKYQLFVKTSYSTRYESIDYAKDDSDKKYLMNEYRLVYKNDGILKAVKLPRKYWTE